MLVAQQQRAAPPLLLPTSKRQRAGADRNAGGSVKRGQLGVVVAPLMRMARLHSVYFFLLNPGFIISLRLEGLVGGLINGVTTAGANTLTG